MEWSGDADLNLGSIPSDVGSGKAVGDVGCDLNQNDDEKKIYPDEDMSSSVDIEITSKKDDVDLTHKEDGVSSGASVNGSDNLSRNEGTDVDLITNVVSIPEHSCKQNDAKHDVAVDAKPELTETPPETSNGTEKQGDQDINGNSATEQDNNLSLNAVPTSLTKQESNGVKKTPIKRTASIPTKLPLSRNSSRTSSVNTSPASPGAKPMSKNTKGKQEPLVNGNKLTDVSTSEKGNGSSSPETGKRVLKRKPSKSKLPVSSGTPSDVPNISPLTTQPTVPGKQALLVKCPPSPVDVNSDPIRKKSTSKLPIAESPQPEPPATSTPDPKGGPTAPQAPDIPPITPKNVSQAPKNAMTPRRIIEENEAWKEQVKQFQLFKMAMSETVNCDPRTRFLRCLFCTHLFTMNGREPRMLGCCLNAICTACASKLCLENSTHLRCPVCRQSIAQPHVNKTDESIDVIDESVTDGGTVDLPVELIRIKTMEFQHIQKGLTFPCMVCKKTQSTWFCENCDGYMCDVCRDDHKEDIKTKRHSTVAVTNLKARQLKDFKQHYCKDHSFSKVTLYCTTCKQVVCNMCIRDGHDRDTHNVLTIQEAFGARIKQTGKLLSKARKKHRHLTDYGQSLKLRSDSNGVSETAAKESINEVFDHLMDIMQRRRTELLDEVERESSTLTTSATVDTDSTDCRLSMLNTATDYAKEFKSKADNVEFLQLFPMVSSSLKNALDIPNGQIHTSRQGVVFSPWNLNMVETLLKTAGQLRVVTYKPTGRKGREEVQLKPSLRPEGHDLDVITTIEEQGKEDKTIKDIVCCHDDRVIIIPASEDRGAIRISCPRLSFDLQTLHSDRTVTPEGVMVNYTPERPLPNTGCRLRAYPGSMADTALDGTGFMMWVVKTKVHIKQRVPDNKMLFEAALTGTPVDAPLSQRIDSSLVLAGCDLHHELCIKIKYCCKNLAHFCGCKNAVGVSADFQFGMLLDFDRRRLHVLDLLSNTVVSKAERISVHKPLWSIFCVGRFTYADVKLELNTADKVKITPELFQLLTKVVDQERAPKK
ncbi:uncharacterized protein [Haliotis asinina]|uniref:uncharacterized protein n=1 Tax=Haliotis asinina TaxID=109174 RepID=UPI0035321A0E